MVTKQSKNEARDLFLRNAPYVVKREIIKQLLFQHLGWPLSEPLFQPIYNASYDCENIVEDEPRQVRKNRLKSSFKDEFAGFALAGDRNYMMTRSWLEHDHVKTRINPSVWMNTSKTCWMFREILVPVLYDTVVLRSKPCSVRSVQCLQASRHWRHVRSLIFVGTGEEFECEETGELMPATNPRLVAEMATLRSILTDLPPNLESLTLDFPNARLACYGDSLRKKLWESSSSRRCDSCTMVGPRYMAMIETVISAISTNNIASKPGFELKLLSLPLFVAPAYKSADFHQFLNHVTSFTLSFSEWKNEWYQPSGNHSSIFFESIEGIKSISTYFLNHVHRVESLCIRTARRKWVWAEIGQAPCGIPLDLPTTAGMPNLKHISFENCMIYRRMIKFFLAHAKTLETITLKGCFVRTGTIDDSVWTLPVHPTWTDLFSSLLNAWPPMEKLVNVDFVAHPLHDCDYTLVYGHDDLLWDPQDERVYDLADNGQEVWGVLCQEQRREDELQHAGSSLASFRRRRKRILEHRKALAPHEGDLRDREANQDEFSKGHYHEAWLELVGFLERNMVAAGMLVDGLDSV